MYRLCLRCEEGSDPVVCRPSYSEWFGESFQKDIVINRIEGCTHIQQGEEGNLALINGGIYIRQHPDYNLETVEGIIHTFKLRWQVVIKVLNTWHVVMLIKESWTIIGRIDMGMLF